MKPITLQEAFNAIDSSPGYFPYPAVKYLIEHKLTKKLEDKIVYELNHILESEKAIPFFYAVVAEEQLSSKFIDPIIKYLMTGTP